MSHTSTATATASDWQRTADGILGLHKHILASGEMSDVRFAVGRQLGEAKIFPAHKFVLSLNSTVFRTMFNGNWKESGEQPIDVPEILPEAFSNMLKYMYTGSVDATDDLKVNNIFETIYCADKYDLPMLGDLCSNFINNKLFALNAHTCLIYLEKVKRCACIQPDRAAAIETKCLEFADKFSRNVLESDQFSAIGQDVLKAIVQRGTLSAGEEIVCSAVEKWAVAQCAQENLEPTQANRRTVLGDALFCVRFPLLTDAQLANGPVQSGLLLESEVADLYRYKHYQYKPSNYRPQLPFPTQHRSGSVLRLSKGDVEFTNGEQVFVDCGQGELWYPAVVKGIRGAEISVMRTGKQTMLHCRPYKIVRAADVLKTGQEIKARVGRRYVTATLRTIWNNHYTVEVDHKYHEIQLRQLRIGQDQMKSWKKANCTCFYC
ncbi:BTB/POZ domain-containing protein 6-B-like [Paramacrobiotus metropolitanus]|uniref:BTB/POZ domain-containing protein 6-B-like n=1 Tax=Paramacrobiotus metropolitanus TaxID=2943436 RepID=UPI002445E255|nr:BTB/POZ domain-containing protein 6-B-like [Paramacrobiotus metropolitanus]